MPSERQVIAAGIANEYFFIKHVNKHIEKVGGEVTLIIRAGSRNLRIENARKAVGVGADVSNRKKSDVNILTDKRTHVPLSIKKDNAQMWESADSYFGKHAKKLLTKHSDDVNIQPIKKNSNVMKMEPSLAAPARATERKNVVFGSDILKLKGAVVIRTFRAGDFKYNKRFNTLTVNVSSVIKRVADIHGTKDDVWFLIRNDSTRKSRTIGINGLRTLAVYKQRINRNVMKVKR